MGDYLLQLPTELIETILECQVLSLPDLCNLSITCTKLKALIDGSTKLWKVKFQNLYPRLERVYKINDLNDKVNWQDECKTRVLLGKQVEIELQKLMSECFMKDDLSNHDYDSFMNMSYGHPVGSWLIIDHLMSIVNSINRDINLTQKFYAEKVLRFIRQRNLGDEWQKLKNAPPEEQILEKGAVIVAQWCQPTLDVTHEYISTQFDKITSDVIKEVNIITNGSHPLLNVSQEQRQHWAKFNIDDNQWSYNENSAIIEAVSNVLFKQMNFHGNQEFYYYPENSFINKVISDRRGIPISLSILYESVTRRLGVKCEAVSFPGHFLLRWRRHYQKTENCEYFYIDVFNGGRLFSKSSCPQFESVFPAVCPMSNKIQFEAANVDEVVQRMAHNLEVANRQRTSMVGRNDRLKSVLELLHMLNPLDLNILLQLSRFYMYLNIEISGLLEKMRNLLALNGHERRGLGQAYHMLTELSDYQERISKELQNFKMVVKNRSANCAVKYHVGMIMHHKLYNYKCVIYGWDPECNESEDWIYQMGVNNLARKSKQPFYQVLVNDGSQRYAAEDNLTIFSAGCVVDHHLVGRYFDEFCQTHYRPNKMKAMEYPDDKINLTV